MADSKPLKAAIMTANENEGVILSMVAVLPNAVSGVYSDKVAGNGDYPASTVILNDSEVVAMGLLVTPVHVFTACRVVGYVVCHNDTDNGGCDNCHQSNRLIVGGHMFLRSRKSVRGNTTSSYHFRPYSVENVTLVAGSKWIYELQGGQSRTVGNSYGHPDCEIHDWEVISHNVGVFEARDRFIFTANLQTVALWSDCYNLWEKRYQYLESIGAKCVVVGWGKTKDGNYSERLLVADVEIVSSDFCIDQFCEISDDLCLALVQHFEEYGKFCAQNVGQTYPCHNDVGASLYCDNYVHGILSRTFNCSQDSLSVFDKVHKSLDLYITIMKEASTASTVTSIRVFVVAATLVLSATNFVQE